MMNLINKFLASRLVTIILIAALGLSVLYIYREGKQACEADNLRAVISETSTAIEEREDAETQVRNTDDIDALLTSLGIMRNRENR